MISSLQNPYIKHLVKLRQDAAYRRQTGQLVISGQKLIAEVGKRIPLLTVLAADPALIPAAFKTAKQLIVSLEIIKKITGLISPDGLAAEITMPEQKNFYNKDKLLALDGVSDPGNLGTLFRSALSFGWEGIFLLPNCCDPYNEKAIRASRGAVLYLPWQGGSWPVLQKIITAQNLHPYAADLKGEPIHALTPGKKTLLVLGSEPKGLSDLSKIHCQLITIPMSGKMESLNVAAAGSILLYHLGATCKAPSGNGSSRPLGKK